MENSKRSWVLVIFLMVVIGIILSYNSTKTVTITDQYRGPIREIHTIIINNCSSSYIDPKILAILNGSFYQNQQITPVNENTNKNTNKNTNEDTDENTVHALKGGLGSEEKGCQTQTLQEALDAFDWEPYKPYEGKRWPTHLMEKYQNVLVPYLELEVAPIKQMYRKVPLSKTLNCENPDYASFLTGKKRDKVPKVYDFFMFNSELDVLEARLYELNDTVDLFVLLESTHSHRGVRKPLFFARNYERFTPLLDKIIHIVSDFSDIYKYVKDTQDNSDFWTIENSGRDYLWKSFIEALGDEDEISADDLLIGGDLDEIPAGEMTYHMKHCELKGTPLRFDTYFYRFNFHWEHPDGLPYPTIFTKKDIKGRGDFCRKCSSAHHVPRLGAHTTYFGPTAFMLWKQLTIAEGGLMPDMETAKNAKKMDALIANGKRVCCPGDNLHHLTEKDWEKYWIPWFPKANKERFPYMFPSHTSRS